MSRSSRPDLAITRATTKPYAAAPLVIPPEVVTTEPPADLQGFVCTCGSNVPFSVVAPNIGMAWAVAMERFGAEHPDELPSPRSMRPVPQVVSGEIAGDAWCADGKTHTMDVSAIVRLTAEDGQP